jgi:protein deglycase
MIVLPGGLPGATNLEADERVQRLLRRHHAEGRYAAAICAAPKVLARAGLLDGRSATGYPGAAQGRGLPRGAAGRCPGGGRRQRGHLPGTRHRHGLRLR